ncbi:MAG: HIT family protein [Vampirovibrionales bacterium]
MPSYPKVAESHQCHQDPFRVSGEHPLSTLVVLQGERGGYLQLAPAAPVTSYTDAPPELFLAAKAWASFLERECPDIARVYWLTFSEVVPHLHIHLYPRYGTDTLTGTALFDARHTSAQPSWTNLQQQGLSAWSLQWGVTLL